MSSLEKRWLRGDYDSQIVGCPMEEGKTVFSTASESRTRSNGYKLQESLVGHQEEISEGQGSLTVVQIAK